MNCVVLQSAEGTHRRVEAGKPYNLQPGERVLHIDRGCTGVLPPPLFGVQASIMKELDAVVGNGMGNWIKTLAGPVARAMGKTHCTACEARRVVANAYAKLKAKYGKLEALVKIKELWMLSTKESGDKVLYKLKEYLSD